MRWVNSLPKLATEKFTLWICSKSLFEIYKRDFKLFKYDFENPGNKMPIGEIDLDEVHAKLGPNG